MKIASTKISINYVLDNNRFMSFVVHSILHLLFFFIRKINRLLLFEGDKVVLISLQRLGDTIFTFQAVNELRQHFSKELIVVCYPESVPIYKLQFNDLTFSTIKNTDFYFGNRIALSKIRRNLKSLNPGLIIDITGTMVSASLIFNSRAKRIIGTNGIQFKNIYDDYVPMRLTPKLKDIYLDAISPLVKPSDTNKIISNKPVQKSFGKILIQPFAGWKEKEWNFKKYVNLSQKLQVNFSTGFLIQKGQLADDVVDELMNLGIEVIQTNSVEELINEIKECATFIGNDSGPINIANYFGKPSFTIYGATNPDYTSQGTEHQNHIQLKMTCSALQNEKCCIIGLAVLKCSGIQCMNLLGVEEIYNNLISSIESYCVSKPQ